MIAFTFRKRFTGRAILFAALCLFVFGAAQAQNPFTVTGGTQGTDIPPPVIARSPQLDWDSNLPPPVIARNEAIYLISVNYYL